MINSLSFNVIFINGLPKLSYISINSIIFYSYSANIS